MLAREVAARRGGVDWSGLFERFVGVEKVAPTSVERLKKMLKLPEVSFCQTTLMLPLESTAIRGSSELPVLEIFFGVENTCAWATSADAARPSRPASAPRLMNLSKRVFARIIAH